MKKLLKLLMLGLSCFTLTGCFSTALIVTTIIKHNSKKNSEDDATLVIESSSTAKLYVSDSSSIPMRTYKVRGKDDIAYVNFKEFYAHIFMSIAANTYVEQNNYTLSVEEDGNDLVFTNAYGYYRFNADNDTLFISETAHNLFLVGYVNNHQVIADGIDTNHINVFDTTYQNRQSVSFNFKDYNIQIYQDENKIYMPLNTFVGMFLNTNAFGFVFNGKDLYYSGAFGQDPFGSSELTSIESRFYNESPWRKKSSRSQSLAEFTYNEMCFELDHFYGLKVTRGISSFDDVFNSLGVKENLKSTSTSKYEDALIKFSTKFLFEGHSGFTKISPMKQGTNYGALMQTGYATNEYYTRLINTMNELTTTRNNYGKGVGLSTYLNTAIITFDSFMKDSTNNSSLEDNYRYLSYESLHDIDTYYMVRKAFDEIKDNNTITKVVFDITLNGGGMLDVIPWLEAFMTRTPSIVVHNTLNNETNEIQYQVDLNRDGSFATYEWDDSDSYQGKYDFYLMTSNFSFSCGNYFPTVVKDKGMATLIGERSGGGSCAVSTFSTASGDVFSLSSCFQLGTMNYGFKDNEAGVEVDYSFSRSNFYNDYSIYSFVNGL